QRHRLARHQRHQHQRLGAQRHLLELERLSYPPACVPVAALCILLLASPPGDLTAGSRPSPARAPATITAVALTSEGLDREALREALALRAPDVRLLPTGAACEARCAVVLARRGDGGIINIEARLA